MYNTLAWQRLSSRVLRAWRGEHGDWCPGYPRAAHPASDLTVDHVVPLAAGGAPFDIGNCAVLCRSCNSTKGASTDRGGVAHRDTRMLPDRQLAYNRGEDGGADEIESGRRHAHGTPGGVGGGDPKATGRRAPGLRSVCERRARRFQRVRSKT
ncbi:MAG: HNH endonuclease [Chloroflexi bacterium]|nr:HNH endonuclease [Chloroflexota bacterium]